MLWVGWLSSPSGKTQSLPPQVEAPPADLSDPQDVEAFVEQFVTARSLPGAAFALVKDGKLIASRGYGYADVAQQRPVRPETTLFRVASISKLFTTVAVLQLYEQGKIRLDDNINHYLQAFQIEETYPSPLTAESLLTHTDGFDVAWGIGAANTGRASFLPLDQFLQERLPPRVIPPEQVYLYGDAGMTVAGYLAQEVAGVPFEEYVEQQIFQPLEMQHSSFRQPLPLRLADEVAVGYEEDGTAVPFQWVQSVPAIALSTTALDMANFMLANLQEGQFNNRRILSETTTHQMHRQQFVHHPELPGSAYGFYLRDQNDRLILEHGGVMPGFASLLFLIPEDNLGFFLAANGFQLDLPERLMQAFLARYYPADPQPQPPPTPAGQLSPEQARHFTGTYRFNRYPQTSFEKLSALIGLIPEIRVAATPEGYLNIQNASFAEVEPLLFQHVGGTSQLAFRQNQQGQITHIFLGQSVFQVFEKLAWFETVRFNLLLLGGCVLVFLSMGVAQLITLYRRWRKHGSSQSRTLRWAMHLAGLMGGLNLLFIIGIGLTLALTDFWVLYEGMPLLALLLLCVPPITTGLTVGLGIGTLILWRNPTGAVWQKLHYTLVTLAAIGFVWFVEFWNLFGFRLA